MWEYWCHWCLGNLGMLLNNTHFRKFWKYLAWVDFSIFFHQTSFNWIFLKTPCNTLPDESHCKLPETKTWSGGWWGISNSQHLFRFCAIFWFESFLFTIIVTPIFFQKRITAHSESVLFPMSPAFAAFSRWPYPSPSASQSIKTPSHSTPHHLPANRLSTAHLADSFLWDQLVGHREQHTEHRESLRASGRFTRSQVHCKGGSMNAQCFFYNVLGNYIPDGSHLPY